jgi:uncharacterized protein (TIGR02246 family)
MGKKTKLLVPAFLALAATHGVIASGGLVGVLRASDESRPEGGQVSQESPVARDDNEQRGADRAAIRKTAEGLIKAFEGRDAKALASLWTSEGEFIADAGTTVTGREALENAYTGFFKDNPKVKLQIESESIRFVSRDTAIEEGFATLDRGASEPPTPSRYSMLHAREDGQWRIALLREWPSEETSLRELSWLIGTWQSKEGEGLVQTTYEWEGDKAFIRARFTIKMPEATYTGTQMIGNDPSTGRLRSWTFESKGGFGEASWSRDGSRWVLEATGVIPDGGTMSARNILARINDDTFTWQSIDRSADDAELPDLPPVKVTRVKSPK